MTTVLVDVAVRFTNPTRELVPTLLARVDETICYGPGHVSTETLDAGLDRFLERVRATRIVTTEHVAFAALNKAHGATLESAYANHVFDFDPAQFSHLSDIATQVGRCDLPKVLLLFESDYYHFTEARASILEYFDCIIGFGPQFVRPRAELDDINAESFAAHVTDHAADAFQRLVERTACLPHFVSDAEFCWNSLHNRPQSWSVPGVGYAARREAAHALAEIGFAEGRSLLGRLLMRPRFPQEWRSIGTQLYRHSFRRMLERSRYAFTCGSGLRYPLRKFFEIPAAGALLVAQPFVNFADAGFVHGKNCIIAEPAILPAIHHQLARDPDWAESIAAAGRAMILANHSVTARALQLSEVFAALDAGVFAGGQWRSGAFKVFRREAADTPLRDGAFSE